jgi:hypothetical protein
MIADKLNKRASNCVDRLIINADPLHKAKRLNEDKLIYRLYIKGRT